MILNRIRPEIVPILRKNQNGFKGNRSTPGQILIIRRILESVKSKNLPLSLLFIDYSKAFDSIKRNTMAILKIYGIPTGNIEPIMMLYRNTCYMIRSPDDTRLQLAYCKAILLLLSCLYYVSTIFLRLLWI